MYMTMLTHIQPFPPKCMTDFDESYYFQKRGLHILKTMLQQSPTLLRSVLDDRHNQLLSAVVPDFIISLLPWTALRYETLSENVLKMYLLTGTHNVIENIISFL